MTSLLNRLSLCLLVLQMFVTGTQGESENAPDKLSLQSLEEHETVLPCFGENVEQVIWNKVSPDGRKEQMITAHRIHGQIAFGKWADRLRFADSKPTTNSTLVITSTRLSDEGNYLCEITTFPSGKFEKELFLTVWTVPISYLEPMVVKEGEIIMQAAFCRSVARPAPMLSWDTELNGRSFNWTSDNGAVSTRFSLYPLRSMNGKKLDCLVWHPVYKIPRRFKSQLEVHFPPDAKVSHLTEEWTVGTENAALSCKHEGNPEPTLTWTRVDGDLPQGVVLHRDGRLVFSRPLNISDEGTYQCFVNNTEGIAKAEIQITVGDSRNQGSNPDNLMMLMVGGAAGGLLIVMLVIVIILTCHHKRKNKKLQKELNHTKEEVCTLTRQASFRRVNSVSTDAREDTIALRVEGTLKNSLSSLGEQARCRDSRSTVSCGRGGAFDSLGRPAINNNSRRGRDRPMDRDSETRLRVEQYVRHSNMSLQDNFILPPSLQATFPVVRSPDVKRQMNGSAVIPTDAGSQSGSTIRSYQPPSMSCTYPHATYDEDEVDEGLGGPASQEHPDDQDSEESSLNLSKNRMNSQPHNYEPHVSYVHKAQIV